MTETDWLHDKAADRMLEFVADRLAPRQWRFLVCGLVRKVADLLPAGPLTETVESVELQADEKLTEKARAKCLASLRPEIARAAAHAEAEMRAIVRAADPDAGRVPPGSGPDPDELPPSRVLFDAASRHAALAVDHLMAAAQTAAEAALNVLRPPGEETFALVQEQVQDALARKTAAYEAANNALKLKHLGDEFADNANPRTVRLDRSKAVAHVNRIDESSGGVDTDRAERLARKHLARLLHEVVGNPFRTVRFDAAWRTTNARDVAQSIFQTRAFDRLPMLADALLDADCDEEALLRHCRGTELHLKEAKDAPLHVRGCWVVELVLDRWKPLKAPKPSKAKKPKAVDWLDINFEELGLKDDDRFA